MPTCFVIQPFDRGPFDKRYKEVIEPSIVRAGLEAYRVDNDPAVEVPIEDIERGIRAAVVCFADVTLDNPNVWFEVGYAIAARKPMCFVCSADRNTPYPFDIQHRYIIKYGRDSASDFSDLSRNVYDKLVSLVAKQESLELLADQPSSQSTETELSPHEVAALCVLLEGQLYADGSVYGSVLARDMESAGFTKHAASIGVNALIHRKFAIRSVIDHESDGWNESGKATCFTITDIGQDWAARNQHKMQLRRSRDTRDQPSINYIDESDIPF